MELSYPEAPVGVDFIGVWRPNFMRSLMAKDAVGGWWYLPPFDKASWVAYWSVSAVILEGWNEFTRDGTLKLVEDFPFADSSSIEGGW